MGNCKVERAKLSPGFIPLGVKEYGGIIYIASYNPDTQEEEVGCFPSPERDITGSTKIENQTGLTDGKFSSSDYRLPTSRVNEDFIPDALISKIQKLNEQEILKLNPGDKYITTFKLKRVSGSEPINGNNFNNYFSFDEYNKKLFNVNFYRIDSDNNVIKVENSIIKSIPYNTAIKEDEYVYFTENSGGALAVEIKLNSIDYFSANVREISKKSDLNKKVRIEAIGDSVSSMTFEGIRIDVTKNKELVGEEVKVYHLGKTIPEEEKVSGTIKDLKAEDTLDCEITPYTKYGYLADLKQSFFLKIGEDLNSDVVNEVFKWFVNTRSDRLELDFDFKLDTETSFKLFLEFYDPWSNVSTIRTVTNPSIYGPMRLTIDLVDEPKTQVFDTYPNNGGQYGGIPMSRLIESNSLNNKPILIDPSKSNGKLLIRSDNSLRKNHFYLVRICGYEEVVNGEVVTYIKNDVYRGLYTNIAYNDIYTEQSSMTDLNPEYTPNFNDIPYPKEKIKLSASKTGGDTQLTFATPVLTEDPNDIPRTSYKNVPQMFSLSQRPSATRVILNTHYTAKKNYTLLLNRSDEFIYGSLKDNIIEVLTDSTEVVLKPENIIDIDLDSTIPMRSKGSITIPELSGTSDIFTVELKLETQRPSRGLTVNTPPILGATQVRLIDKMYKPNWTNTRPSIFTLYRAKPNGDNANEEIKHDQDIQLYYIMWDKSNSSHKVTYEGTNVTYRSGIRLINKVDHWPNNSALTANFYSVYYDSFLRLTSGGTSTGLKGGVGVIFMTNGLSPSIINIPIYNSTSANIHNLLKAALSSMYYEQYSDVPTTGYYISRDSYLYYDQNSESRFVNMSFDIKTGWVPQTKKVYIFKSYDRNTGATVDFTTAKINTIINKAIAREPSNVLNNSLQDNNFIPFVDNTTSYEDTNFNIALSDEVIKKPSDPEQVRLLSNSQDSFEARKNEINNIDVNALQPIQVDFDFTGGLNYTRRKEFANMFKFDPLTNSLKFDGAATSTMDMVADNNNDKRTEVFRSTQTLSLS